MEKYDAELFNDIYKEICAILGKETALEMHRMYKGQQITFPVHLYNSDRIVYSVATEYDGSNLRELARKYDYSEKTLRRMIRDVLKEKK